MSTADLRTEIAVAILKSVLEDEGVVSSDSTLKEMREDAHNIADTVYIYTEAILSKFMGLQTPTLAGTSAMSDVLRPQEIR